MAHESFENEAIAALLNEHFVPVKLDREERPDVDRVYMAYLQALTGQGGWPLSVWLTPDLKPFYAGTYFPPEDRQGRAGFPDDPPRDRAGLEGGPGEARRGGRARRRDSEGARGGRGAAGDRGAPSRAPRARRSRRPTSTTPRRSTRATGASAARRNSRGRQTSRSCCAARRSRVWRARRGARRRRWSRATLGGHGARRDPRPRGRRISPLLGRRRVVRAALREDALRPGADRLVRARTRGRRPATSGPRGSRARRSTTCCAT